jgi:hypothetical protein
LLVGNGARDLLQGETHVDGTYRDSQNIDGIGINHGGRAVIAQNRARVWLQERQGNARTLERILAEPCPKTRTILGPGHERLLASSAKSEGPGFQANRKLPLDIVY